MTPEEENLTVRDIAVVADGCTEKAMPLSWIFDAKCFIKKATPMSTTLGLFGFVGKEKLTGTCVMSSSHVANQGDGPPDAQAIDGACGQLVEQNALPSNETCDLEAWKKRENINVLNQARSNIAALRNESTANKIKIYANIAAAIPTKTIRDVAWRVKLMAELLSDPPADSSSHVADQEDDRTSKALSESPEAMDPQLELDEELVGGMPTPRSSM